MEIKQQAVEAIAKLKQQAGWQEVSLEQFISTHAYYHMVDVNPYEVSRPDGEEEAAEARRQAVALEALYRLEFTGKRIFIWEVEFGHSNYGEFRTILEGAADEERTWFHFDYQAHYAADDYGTRYAGGQLYRLTLGGSPFASGCDTYIYTL